MDSIKQALVSLGEQPRVVSAMSYASALLETALQKTQTSEFQTACTVTAVGALLLAVALRRTPRSRKRGSRKQRGGQSCAQGAALKSRPKLSLKEQIDAVYAKYMDEYKTGLHQLLENYDPAREKDQYQRKYYNEMLLKLLIELDGVDLVDLPAEEKAALKEKRKQTIKEIQSELKKLDALKA
ncbi:LAMI_0B04720g1_1 [Lachancea mirantina]|uniref:LAMI_0B04720g1_1 n=1 Tax=Lachancea mirantina TaxID=1230905 RepID=A0A1G4IW12_9SACH|nr:LAMI_0B04720g1_1 [Lachancea mirantina]